MDKTIYIGTEPKPFNGRQLINMGCLPNSYGLVAFTDGTLYVCHDKITDTIVVVNKGTVSGNQITEILAKAEPREKLEDFILSLVLQSIPAKDFRRWIEMSNSEYFNRGVEFRDRELMGILGINIAKIE